MIAGVPPLPEAVAAVTENVEPAGTRKLTVAAPAQSLYTPFPANDSVSTVYEIVAAYPVHTPVTVMLTNSHTE